MIRRWNITIIIIICTFVLGIAAGYTYRDQFGSGVSVDEGVTKAELESQLFKSHVEALLKPTSGLEATTAPNEVYTVTGRIVAKSANQLDVEVPSATLPDADTLSFLLTDETVYATLTMLDSAEGPVPSETETTLANIAVGDTVSVYSLEDLLSTEEWHASKVQKLNNN